MTANRVREFVDATKWAKQVLYVDVIVHALPVLLFMAMFVVSESGREGLGTGMVISGYLSWAVNILTIILMLVWVYRANRNCHDLGGIGLDNVPREAVRSFLIPILNIWTSYIAIKEIWGVSKDPENWRMQPLDMFVRWWWVLLVVTFALRSVNLLIWRIGGNAESSDLATLAFWGQMIWHLLSIALCGMTLELLDTIHSRQLAQFTRLSEAEN